MSSKGSIRPPWMRPGETAKEALEREFGFARNASAIIEALVDVVEAARRAEEVLALCTVRDFDAPEDAHVRQLGERIGFGALMSAASKTWAEWLREQGMPPGSNFAPGPCVATVERTLEELRAALAKLDAHEKEG